MRKKNFPIIAILMVFVIIAMIASACSTPAATSDPAPTDEPVADEPAVDEPATDEPAADEPAGFDWQQFAGTDIKVYVVDSGQVDYWSSKIGEFEELTGISVGVETADATSYRNALPVQLLGQSSDYDVVATFPSVDGRQFSANGWYETLDGYISDLNLTNPDFNFDDFPVGAQESMKVGDDTVAILWEMQTQLIYYRKDLLEGAGLSVPNTFDEWLAAADAIHDPDAGIYGVALRGSGYQMTTPYSAFLYGNCGTWLEDGKAAINSPEAIKAFELYGKYGALAPPGVVNFDWQQPSILFSQGQVFLFLDINLFVPTVEDPDSSRVVGKVGYAPVPEGACGRSPFIGGWGYGINPFSENKGAAWYFIQWAASAEINLEQKLDGWPSPRASAWGSSEFQANDPTPQFTEVVLESLRVANAVMNPPVAPGKEAREIVGVVGTKALEGASVEEITAVANEQNEALQVLIDAME